ncbi:MAG: hypothetical protein KAW89_04180 [Armatimonadetes bacterium]|nr:hypothetical protein [Armatimonadota bacterium]
MATVTDHFDALLSAINPPEDRAQRAKETPVPVREHLAGSDTLDTVEPHTRLIGSYARDTAVMEIKDVDILVFLDPAKYTGESPVGVLGDLHVALEDMPDAAGVNLAPQRRSVRVSYADFELDIVPAIAPLGTDYSVRIPDCDQLEWIDSHPLGYQQYLSDLNARTDDRVVPMIKLIKYWRDYQAAEVKTSKPASYLIEVELTHVFRRIPSLAGVGEDELFTKLLRGMHDDFSPSAQVEGVPSVHDPMLGNDIADDVNWLPSEVKFFVATMFESLELAERALDEEDQEECVEIWKLVFGDEFGDGRRRQAAKRAELSKAGKLSEAPAGIIREEGGDIPVPKHKFYGD